MPLVLNKLKLPTFQKVYSKIICTAQISLAVDCKEQENLILGLELGSELSCGYGVVGLHLVMMGVRYSFVLNYNSV